MYRHRNLRPRKYSGSEPVDVFLRLAGLVVALFVFSAISLYWTDRARFWRYVITAVAIIFGIIAIAIGTAVYAEHRERVRQAEALRARAAHFDELIQTIQRLDLVAAIFKFIDNRSSTTARESAWSYRGKYFSCHDLEDLTAVLKRGGVPLADVSDLKEIMQFFIQKKGQKSITESIMQKSGAKDRELATIVPSRHSSMAIADTHTSDVNQCLSGPSNATVIGEQTVGNKLLWNLAVPIVVAVIGGVVAGLILAAI